MQMFARGSQQLLKRGIAHRADEERRAVLGERAAGGKRVVGKRNDVACELEEQPTGHRQLESAVALHYERRSHFVFERFDMRAQRRLRHEQRFRCFGIVQRLRERDVLA